jgi:hypothetical protein
MPYEYPATGKDLLTVLENVLTGARNSSRLWV